MRVVYLAKIVIFCVFGKYLTRRLAWSLRVKIAINYFYSLVGRDYSLHLAAMKWRFMRPML